MMALKTLNDTLKTSMTTDEDNRRSLTDSPCLVFEMLFALEGINSDLSAKRGEDSCIQWEPIECHNYLLNGSISVSEMNLMNGLLSVANLYIRINHFIQKYSADLNPYNRRLAQSMDKSVIDYRNALIEVEIDIHRNPDYSIIKFNKFLKYYQTFDFLNQIITQFNENPDSFAATLDSLNESSLSGFTSIQNCAKIVFKSSESLYSDIWSWIMFGFLSKKSNNNFFIKEEKNKTTVDMKRVPAFMSPNDALKIQQIGENVRLAKSRGLDFVFNNKENELFKTYNEMTAKVPVDGRSFQQFIESVRSIVSEQNWKYVMNEEGLKDHLRSLKMFYLTANDDFWTSFVSITSELVLNGHNRYKKDIQNAFLSSLRQNFAENTMNDILAVFSMTTSEDENNYTVVLNYKMPSTLQHIISDDSIDKYNKIMNFLLTLYMSRIRLNQIWFKPMKCKENAIKGSSLNVMAMTLRHSLSYIVNAFYYYFKTDVIERLFMKFMDKIERTRDVEEIQKEHQILLSDIIGQMFLKTAVINKCLEQIFSFCNRLKTCSDSEDLLTALIEDFERTKRQIYHLLVNIESYKTHQMVSNLVLELEKCSKQQIIFN